MPLNEQSNRDIEAVKRAAGTPSPSLRRDPVDVRTIASTGAMKDDGAKLERYDLIPEMPERLLAQLYGFGAVKYADRNWEKGFPWSKPYAALRRHLAAFWRGEELDDGPGGSGLPHLVAVIWNAMALLEFTETHPELDDRPRKP